MDRMRITKVSDAAHGSTTEFGAMRSVTVGHIQPGSRGHSGASRTKRSSDMSGAEINDHMSASDSDSPRRRDGSGINGGTNPSVVTLGANGNRGKNGGASIPGTG